MNSGNPRGSEWSKWDLHIHTPASIIQHYGDKNQDETWDTYIRALENLPSEIKAIGINDYFFLDGYARLLDAKDGGKLKNIELILPAIELRIANLVGSKQLRKINFHVIFSNDLTVEEINLYFLQELRVEFDLDDTNKWRGNIGHPQKLIDLGKAIRESSPKTKRDTDSDLKLGFRNAAIPIDNIHEALNNSIFDGKIITAVGLSEWGQMRWDGGGAAIKKNIINKADLVFTASMSPEQYYERRDELIKQNVTDSLLDCSDAHYYEDSSEPNKLGNVFSWIKADLTFQGLQRAVQRFDDRIFIGDTPLNLINIDKRKTKYIKSVEIRRKENSRLDEVWFDCEIPVNSELVAIIGNQGNGKSALTDIIALCGGSKISKFSFLNEDKFCDRENKAKEFVAKLTWEDGSQSIKSLDESIMESDVERVRYVPQGFFDAITNETVVNEDGLFYSEIKKAIYSHIPDSDRLECASFDELLELRTNTIGHTLGNKRQELRRINLKIVSIENECSQENIDRLEKMIEAKRVEITAHENSKPEKVDEPIETEEISSRLEILREDEREISERIKDSKRSLQSFKRQREILRQAITSIESEIDRFRSFIENQVSALSDAGIAVEFDINQHISISADTTPMSFAIGKLDDEILKLENSLNPDIENSLLQQQDACNDERAALEVELKLAGQEYQKYLNELNSWQKQLDNLHGNTNTADSLQWLEHQLKIIRVDKPLSLIDLQKDRLAVCEDIFDQIVLLAQVFKDLTQPVHDHIKSNELAREKYRIDFGIDLVVDKFADKLFGIVSHGTGTFSGVLDGRDKLEQIINRHNFSTAENIIEFIDDVLNNLKQNYKNDPPTPMDLSKLVKRGFEVVDIYNLLFGLEYLRPQYSLALNEKSLKQLSPGERGILLLVFYLVVDRGEEPLIIDQPEGNLNNQSIYKNLVPVFNDAKERRQIIIVTHNPNIAVVCDAEQIIYAQIIKDEGNRAIYESGSLENPTFNKLSIDVLEGTPPAFDARRMTYFQETG